MATTPFDRHGGFATVSRIVLAFYDRILDDDDVGPYFDGVDLPRLIDHQTKFIAFIMGGPASFSDEHLSRVHQRHNIALADFNRMVDILAGVLAEAGIEGEDHALVIARLRERAPLIVGRTDA
jgi:hemoglobin